MVWSNIFYKLDSTQNYKEILRALFKVYGISLTKMYLIQKALQSFRATLKSKDILHQFHLQISRLFVTPHSHNK